MNPYSLNHIDKTINGYSLPIASDTYATQLAANVNQTYTVPSFPSNPMATVSPSGKQKALIVIRTPGTVYVANNATATAPGSSFSQTSSPSLNRDRDNAFSVFPGDVLDFLTTDTDGTTVDFSFYLLST